MALVVSTTIAVNDTTSSYVISVTGKSYASNGLSISLYVGGVNVATMTGVGVSQLTLSGVDALDVWTNINGKSRTNGCYAIAEEWTSDLMTLIQTSAKKYGNVTINTRLTAATPTSPTTGSPLDIGLVNPVNVVAAVTYPANNPSNFFKLWAEILVWNGSAWVLCADRSATANLDWDVPSFSTTDRDAIIAAMGGVSPRDIKIILYTACNFEQLWVVGSAVRTTTIASGVINTTLGGKIKVFLTSFVAKPVKWWNGSAWVEKPLKRWNGSAWVKSKN